jgi:hypothetical protein
MARFELDLGVREPERGDAGRRVRLVAQTVPGLLRRRAVVAQAVGFHDQVELRPVEVDLEPVQSAPGLRPRKSGAPGQREKAALELGVGERERATVQRSPQGRGAGSGGDDVIEGGPERLGIRQIALVGFVDRGLELGPIQPRGNVDELACPVRSTGPRPSNVSWGRPTAYTLRLTR